MSNFLKSNERISVRRSNTPGVIPTIPVDDDFLNWLETDIFDGELFLNTADNKMWIRCDSGITSIVHESGSTNFTDLIDTPIGYEDGKILISTASAITYTEYPDVRINLTDMNDFIGGNYTGYDGYSIVVDEENSGFTYELIDAKAFTDLTDTPSGLTADNFLRVNSRGTEIELVNGYDYFVDLESNQTILGEKTFDDTLTADDIIINSFEISGITISEIKTTLDTSDDNSIATTKAITDFVYENIYSGLTGITGYVTINSAENITSEKIFTEDQYFNKDIILMNELFLGDQDTDGSYKLKKDIYGNLIFEKRESGVWNTYSMIKKIEVTLEVAEWSGGTSITKTVTGITSDNLITMYWSTDEMRELLIEFEVRPTGQDTDEITFEAETTPDEDITLILKIEN